MDDLPSGWRVVAGIVYSKVPSFERWYRIALAGFILFTLVTPLDNLVELPHGLYLWAGGEAEPFAQWKRDYDPEVASRSPVGMTSDGLRLAAQPPLTALPGLGFLPAILIAVTFLGTQYFFFPRHGFSLAVPVFGWFSGGLAGSAALLFLEYTARLRSLDERMRQAASGADWIGTAIRWAGWQNRPWVYLVIAVFGVIAAIAARRLLRRDPAEGRLMLLLILLAGSLGESLAGFAVDLATRIRQPATFLSGTFVTLLISGSMVMWTIGPLLTAWRQARQLSEPAP
ncbi:MAG: hypothetical protein U0Q16_01590 [Bryobacteraceae bacterium]